MTHTNLSLPRITSLCLSTNKPITPQTLIHIRNALNIALSKSEKGSTLDTKKHSGSWISNEQHAAVLIPLANVNDVPGILLEVRGALRTHAGEVR